MQEISRQKVGDTTVEVEPELNPKSEQPRGLQNYQYYLEVHLRLMIVYTIRMIGIRDRNVDSY